MPTEDQFAKAEQPSSPQLLRYLREAQLDGVIQIAVVRRSRQAVVRLITPSCLRVLTFDVWEVTVPKHVYYWRKVFKSASFV